MATFQLCAFWMFVLVGVTHGNHAGRVRTAGIGRIGNPILSIDPFAVPSASSSASSSSASSHSASSSGGSGRTISASTSIGVQPRSLASRVVSKARRRGLPVITRIQGRPMLIVRPGGQGSRMVSRPRLQITRGFDHGQQLPQKSGILEVLGMTQTNVGPRLNVVGHSHQPPGVSFLGGQRLSGNVRQYLPAHSMPMITNSLTQNQLPISVSGLSNLVGGTILSSPSVAQLPPSQRTTSNTIPGSNVLQIGGLTPKGELIIRGPGGTITIGRDLLHGIAHTNAFPLITEFEEVEAEGAARALPPNQSVNTLKLTEPGRGSIVIDKAGGTSAASTAGGSSGNAASNGAGVIEVINSGVNAGSVVASSSSSASSGSSSASSSSATSKSTSSASSSSGGAGKPGVALGNGITVESGGKAGRVIRLGNAAGKTQVITMGGAQGQIQLADGGSGMRVPGNATFIVSR